ncbi:MAG: hypothetical protein PWP03_74 [Candidatus Woesearchaeota archaeon]|nr:hypothetical protein [Candidatus Woesearchaeota archaeon]
MKKKSKKNLSEKARKKRLQIIWGVFISIMFILSSLSIWVSNSSNNNSLNSFKYNGYTFQYSQNKITTQINGATLQFFTTPFDAENMNIPNEALNKMFNAKKVTISIDPNSNYKDALGLAAFYLQTDFLSVGKNAEFGAISQNSFNYSIVTCKDAISDNFVIELVDGNDTKIDEESYCLKLISSQPYGHIILRDALAYRIYGIIRQ